MVSSRLSIVLRSFGVLSLLLLVAAGVSAAADDLRIAAPRLHVGTTWTTILLDAPDLSLAAGWDGRAFWDLRPTDDAGQHRAWTVVTPATAGLAAQADTLGADRALCAREPGATQDLGCHLFRSTDVDVAGAQVLWSNLPGRTAGRRSITTSGIVAETVGTGDRLPDRRVASSRDAWTVRGRAVAEGLVLVPAGPREALLLREELHADGGMRLRYRFITPAGLPVASMEGPLTQSVSDFVPDSVELLQAGVLADDGIEVRYEDLSSALVPGAVGFLQYSTDADTALSGIHPSWSGVPQMITPGAGTTYQPDPGDPATQQNLPEVWDFTGLTLGALTARTFYSTRDELNGTACLESCASRDLGATPPDGTWQSYLKADRFDALGSFSTHDIFTLNVNDSGADPSIDLPYVSLDDLNTDDWLQICFEDSSGTNAGKRLHRFFQFTGPDPSSAVIGVGDTWDTGAWTSCTDFAGLYLFLASQCGDDCYDADFCPDGPLGIAPRARGLLGGGTGFRMTIVEDGWAHMPTGNFIASLLMRQDTNIEAGRDFFGTCNLGTTPNLTYDYFWINRHYGILAFVSSPGDETDSLLPEDWSALGNIADGADFTWGPFPPYQFEARACLGRTRVSWALPADGSNLSGEPGIGDYGYVVSWGSLTDPEALADTASNPNHSPLPGQPGFLAAPSGGEPTFYDITTWPGSTIHATVTTTVSYTDPDLADQRTYRSAAQYKVLEDPARLDPLTYRVGLGVAPFVTRFGAADLQLDWPAVADAPSYRIHVWDLDTMLEIACPAGLDCSPTTNSVTHTAGATAPQSFGYRVNAVDGCDGESVD